MQVTLSRNHLHFMCPLIRPSSEPIRLLSAQDLLAFKRIVVLPCPLIVYNVHLAPEADFVLINHGLYHISLFLGAIQCIILSAPCLRVLLENNFDPSNLGSRLDAKAVKEFECELILSEEEEVASKVTLDMIHAQLTSEVEKLRESVGVVDSYEDLLSRYLVFECESEVVVGVVVVDSYGYCLSKYLVLECIDREAEDFVHEFL